MNFPSQQYYRLGSHVILHYTAGSVYNDEDVYYVIRRFGAKRGYTFPTREEAMDYIRKKHPLITSDKEAMEEKKREKRSSLSVENKWPYFITSRNITGKVRVVNKHFATKEEAEAYLEEHKSELLKEEERWNVNFSGNMLVTASEKERIGAKDAMQQKKIS